MSAVWFLERNSFTFTRTKVLSLQNLITKPSVLWENNYFANVCVVHVCLCICLSIVKVS